MADPIAAGKSASSEPPAATPAPAAAPPPELFPPAHQAAAAVATPAAVAISKDSRPKSLHLLLLLIVFAITGVGSLMLLASAMRPAEGNSAQPPTTATVSPAQPAAPNATANTAVAEPNGAPAAPKWMASTNSRKAGYGANIVFELPADEDVEVWRKQVRPVLTMRCAARTTEVFMVTNSPATIEGNSNRHTVKVSFDGREPIEQTWEHSIDHDALFALNGAAMMRQITSSQQMTVSWAPFNAPPATATFSVGGFDTHRKTAASKCRQ